MVIRLRFQDAMRHHQIDEDIVVPVQYLVVVDANHECSWVILEPISSFKGLYGEIRQALNPWERYKDSNTPYYSVKDVFRDISRNCQGIQNYHRIVVQEEHQDGKGEWTSKDTWTILVVMMQQSIRRVG